MVPRKGLMVEPGTIEPIARLAATAASPFLKWFGNRPGPMGRIVNLRSIVRIVIIVLILGSRKARQKSRVPNMSGDGRVVRVRRDVVRRDLCRRGVSRRDANILWLNIGVLHVDRKGRTKGGKERTNVEPRGCGRGRRQRNPTSVRN